MPRSRGSRPRQRRAFGEERERWRASGEFDRVDEAPVAAPSSGRELPPGTVGVTAPFAAAVWRVDAAQGASVEKEQKMIVLEAMKMETPVGSPVTGTVAEVFVRPGETVAAGQLLAAVAVAS